MGILTSARQRRHEKRASYKAAKVQARTEARETAKLDRKKEEYLQKMARKVRKQDARDLKAQRKHDAKLAEATVQQLKAGRFNAKTMLRYTGAVRVLLPVAIPLVYRAFTQLSQQGTGRGTTAEFSNFVGVGAPQRARIADMRLRLSHRKLPAGFVKDANARLDELENSLDNASGMSASQTSNLTSSVSTELDLLDRQFAEKA
jgi:multidrug efflux pump subunit AcrA (membrane-fusion protein)